MPQAVAGAFAGVARTHSEMRDRRPQEGRCRGRVAPVFRFQEEGKVPLSRVFGQRWAVCGAGLSGTVMTQ